MPATGLPNPDLRGKPRDLPPGLSRGAFVLKSGVASERPRDVFSGQTTPPAPPSRQKNAACDSSVRGSTKIPASQTAFHVLSGDRTTFCFTRRGSFFRGSAISLRSRFFSACSKALCLQTGGAWLSHNRSPERLRRAGCRRGRSFSEPRDPLKQVPFR